MPEAGTDRRANARILYQVAHHDIWWAKSNLWKATNWALLLIAALVGVAQLFEIERSWPSGAVIAVSQLIVAVAAAWYLARLHSDVVVNRRNAEYLEDVAGLDVVRKTLPERSTWGRPCTRGTPFILAMDAALGSACAIAIYYVTMTDCLAILAGVFVFFWGAGCLLWVVTECRRKPDA